jgi:hypothetical protein
MERSSLPTPFRPFQDTRYPTLPNRYPIIKSQWSFSGLGKKMQVIGHDNVSSNDPVDVAEPGRPKRGVDLTVG